MIKTFFKLAAAAIILSGASCASLNSDDFVPKSITQVKKDQGFLGSVSVQATVPDITNSKLPDPIFAKGSNISYGKFYWNDERKIYEVTENTLSKVAMYNSGILKESLENAITQKGLFQRIEQSNVDYVLDVWVIDTYRSPKAATVSNEMFITSIWRLARVKDNKVVICAFVNGHGKWAGSIEKATQDLIQNGLAILSDPAMPHTALDIAGYWPSMGPVITEGYLKFKENWGLLQKGMTEENVRKIIPSMPDRSHCINRYIDDQPAGKRKELYFKNSYNDEYVDFPSGWNIKKVVLSYQPAGRVQISYDPIGDGMNMKSSAMAISIDSIAEEIFEPLYPFYNLTFVNGGLENWELRK